MTAAEPLQKAQIQAALAELDELARLEYDKPLEALLLSRDQVSELRMQRLVGIALKRKFATVSGPAAYSATRARRSWPWPDRSDSMVPVEADAARELALLDDLRKSDDQVRVSWSQFKDDADHERGLFKIVVAYVADKFNQRETKTLRDYLDGPESKSFEAGLDLATLLFDTGVTSPLVGLLGVPTVAVGIALVGIRYGYRKLTDPDEGRMGDGHS